MIICSDTGTARKKVSDPDTLEKFFADLAKKLGLKEEQTKLLGTPEDYHRLETLVTLKPDFKKFLPEVGKNLSILYLKGVI